MDEEERKAIEESVDDFLGEAQPGDGDAGVDFEEKETEEEVVEDEAIESEEEGVKEEVEDSETVVEGEGDEGEVEGEVEEEAEVEEDDTPLTKRELAYLAEINRLSGVPMPREEAPVVSESPKEGKEVQVAEKPATVERMTLDKIMEGYDFDDVVSDPEIFLKVLGNAIQLGSSQTIETVYRNIPGIVSTQVSSQATLNSAIKDFYENNPDLEPVRAYVGRVANELASKNPDWDMAKLFDETAVTTRKALKLRAKVVTSSAPSSGKVKPALAKRPGQANTRNKITVKQSKLQQEIDDLIT